MWVFWSKQTNLKQQKTRTATGRAARDAVDQLQGIKVIFLEQNVKYSYLVPCSAKGFEWDEIIRWNGISCITCILNPEGDSKSTVPLPSRLHLPQKLHSNRLYNTACSARSILGLNSSWWRELWRKRFRTLKEAERVQTAAGTWKMQYSVLLSFRSTTLGLELITIIQYVTGPLRTLRSCHQYIFMGIWVTWWGLYILQKDMNYPF